MRSVLAVRELMVRRSICEPNITSDIARLARAARYGDALARRKNSA
jgi:hypothetical protein